MAGIPVGAEATVQLEVSDADTAAHVGSGDLPVLATPRMVALMEQAACAALAPYLDPAETTVGTRVDVRHLAATAVGGRVSATAVVTAFDGRRVELDLTAHEDAPEGQPRRIGTGTHARTVVQRARFLSGLGSG